MSSKNIIAANYRALVADFPLVSALVALWYTVKLEMGARTAGTGSARMQNRFLNLTSGVAMVVSDLHGDRDAFDRCLAQFSSLYWRGEAQRLIFLGDLIHSSGAPEDDASLSMVLDLIALRKQLNVDNVILLLGNHEMPHIYGVSLAKGHAEFTPRFEHALGPHREHVLAFFDSLPFIVRTAAGVMLAHAGPAPDAIAHATKLQYFDHQAILQAADQTLSQTEDLEPLYQQYQAIYNLSYAELARHYLAVEGPDDPRYPHLLRAFMIGRQNTQFDLLWDLLFSNNEMGQSPAAYLTMCERFLSAFALSGPGEQRVIVSGHIATPNGHEVVNRAHLRISSAAHAQPREAGQYLLFDCARPIRSTEELLDGLRSVFD